MVSLKRAQPLGRCPVVEGGVLWWLSWRRAADHRGVSYRVLGYPNMGFRLDIHSSQDLLPRYIEQDAEQGRGHQASSQSGLGVGCKLCSSSSELRGLGVCAHVRV